MKSITFIFILILNFICFSQAYIEPTAFEMQVKSMKDQINKAEEDKEKSNLSLELINKFKDFYRTKEAFDYSFDSIKSIGFIDSPDKLIKIINWNIERKDHTNQYFGLIIKYDSKSKEYLQYVLEDHSAPLDQISIEYYHNDNWYGALYYKIIPTYIRNKVIYTLLGYDANNNSSQLKIIDAITFTNKKVKFGYPFFQTATKRPFKRVLFEYSKKAYMALKYEPERLRIVFDHLSPEDPSMVDFRQFYIPDMSYDSFDFDGQKWNLQSDIVAINPKANKNNTYQVYDINSEGQMVGKDKKNKWIDPSDKNAPGGANIHVPIMPNDGVKKKKPEKQKAKINENERVTKPKKRDKTFLPYEMILKNKNKKKKRK